MVMIVTFCSASADRGAIDSDFVTRFGLAGLKKGDRNFGGDRPSSALGDFWETTYRWLRLRSAS